MMHKRIFAFLAAFLLITVSRAQDYPQNYFRHPLNIPMQLVANFGEIRANHWHMGLDIRTQHKVNLPVYAAADGYIARVSVEPGGFGQAIYINHPNGYTTVYGHLNSFFPALAQYVKSRQYEQESWDVSLVIPPDLFPVKKSDFIALSGSTGASEGPHVHFEVRDTKTENCLNPLLFGFPIADAVPPTINRLAMYDRNHSTWEQSPQLIAIRKTGNVYTVPGALLRVGSNRISFAIGAVDRLSGSDNPNGIYSAQVFIDGAPVSGFLLDDISYNETRYINAQLDYRYKAEGGSNLQHVTPLPGAREVAYHLSNEDGVIYLKDEEVHTVRIEVADARENKTRIEFSVKYDPSLHKEYMPKGGDRFLPNNVNIFEKGDFELYTTERTIYDTVTLNYTVTDNGAGAISPVFSVLSAAFPAHDTVTVRIRCPEDLDPSLRNRIVIRNVCGSKTYVAKGTWQNGWVTARFRTFGTYQAFVDREAPTVGSPATNLAKASRLVFTPRDNFDAIRSLRVELDGKWLRFTNDKGKSWVYYFDEHFPRGAHELKVSAEDEAGNVMVRTWHVNR